MKALIVTARNVLDGVMYIIIKEATFLKVDAFGVEQLN